MKYAKTSDEKAYQDFLKEILLENCLGWNNNDIAEQHSITLGSTQRLIPDLIVYKNGTVQFIIEVKHPFHTRRHEDIEQLASYMKQLEVNIGIYIGSAIEVYYKKIGDGSCPNLILSTTFKSEDPKGEEFADLFSASSFSLEKIESLYQKYIEEKETNEQTREIIEQLCTPDTVDLVKLFLTEYLESDKKSTVAIKNALNSIYISIKSTSEQEQTIHNTFSKPIIPSTFKQDFKSVNPIVISPKKIRIAGKVNDIAFNLISEIIRINSDKSFKQLYSIFGKKNFIEAVKNINDHKRWFMDEVFTSIDGTKFVISNQWGINGNSKPRFDYLIEIAKSFGIEIDIPYTNKQSSL